MIDLIISVLLLQQYHYPEEQDSPAAIDGAPRLVPVVGTNVGPRKENIQSYVTQSTVTPDEVRWWCWLTPVFQMIKGSEWFTNKVMVTVFYFGRYVGLEIYICKLNMVQVHLHKLKRDLN